MKNRRALFSAISSITMLTLAVIACEDDPKSEFDAGNNTDAANFDSGGIFINPDAKVEPKDANVTCSAALPTDFKVPTITPATAKQVCDKTMLGEYFAKCIASDTSGNAGLKSKDCEDWRKANDACASCIEPTDNSGPVQLFRDRLYYAYNAAGCIGILQKNTAKDSCADAEWVLAECRREACDSCFDKTGIEGDDFNTCRGKATTGDCATYKTKRDKTCSDTGYLDAGSSLSAVNCFPTKQGQAEGDVFVQIATVYCGK